MSAPTPIPEPPPGCKSWVSTSPDGREFELFDRSNVRMASRNGWRIETKAEYLDRAMARDIVIGQIRDDLGPEYPPHVAAAVYEDLRSTETIAYSASRGRLWMDDNIDLTEVADELITRGDA